MKHTKDNKQVILITGCSSGIGKALAINLATAGHSVIAGARNAESLADILSDNLQGITLDVNNAEHINTAVEQVQADHGKLDVLVNNAGYGAMGPLAEMPMRQMQDQFETNVFAPMSMVQRFLPLLRRSSNAQIVNIGSCAGITPTPFSGAYCASKAALHILSEVMRMELKPLGVHVMTVYPGGVASEFGYNANSKLSDTLIDDSSYFEIVAAIEGRAQVSSKSPTTSKQFTAELGSAMFAARPVYTKRIGHGSTLLPLMRYVMPTRLREYIMAKSFKLTDLGAQ
ncbi:MAG: SDR family NAD(P)-dependent oxidoreductase [Halioglobus sp.]